MPLPAALKFADRIAQHGDDWYFLCHRKGHRKVARKFDHESDAKEFRAAHDVTFHSAILQHIGFQRSEHVKIETLCTEWLAHVRRMEIDGIRSPDTTRYYEMLCKRLPPACRAAAIRTTRDITPQRLSEVVRWFRDNTKSQGDLTKKAIAGLRAMVRWKGLPANWKTPLDEIRAQPHERLDFDAETIRKVIAAMPEGSLEQACAYLKARTGAHDVEIYEAKREEFDLDVTITRDGKPVAIGVFRPMLRKKGGRTTNRRRKRHVYVLTSDAVAKLRPFVERAQAGAYVFREANGSHVTRESMRARIRRASRAAGLVKAKKDKTKKKPVTIGEIDSLAQIRAEVITLVVEGSSLAEAAAHSGHDDPSTTSQWYVKDRVTLRRLADAFRPAEIIANAIPLKPPTVN